MTLQELEASKRTTISIRDAASILGCSQWAIRRHTQADCSELPFSVIIIGSHVHVCVPSFLEYARSVL